MTPELALLLAQDGLANGAIYVLVALGIVQVFVVTRVIFVPFGDLVAYASLSLAALEAGRRPGAIWLVLLLSGLALAFEAASRLPRGDLRGFVRAAVAYGVLPLLPVAAALLLAGVPCSCWWCNWALTVALILPIGPLLYRIVFRPIADAPVLVLLIVAVVLHFAVSGLALMAFGPEGARPRLLVDGGVELGGLFFTGQMLLMLAASGAASLLLALFFGRTLAGKALRATAINRTGARLVGIRPGMAGAGAFDRLRARRNLRHPDRPGHHPGVRQRLRHRPQGLRRRHHRRPGQRPARRPRRARRRPARKLRRLLRQRAEGCGRLRPARAHPGPALPAGPRARGRGGGG